METDKNIPSPRPWARWLAAAGLLLVFIATAMPLLKLDGTAFRYIYAAGALCVLIGRACNPCPVPDLRIRRLYRIEVWAGVIFCVGAFFLFYPRAGHMDWMAFTLAGGVIEAYANIMIGRKSHTS